MSIVRRARLESRDGQLVADPLIPVFRHWPGIVMLESRVFVYTQHEDEAGSPVYRESQMWIAQPPIPDLEASVPRLAP